MSYVRRNGNILDMRASTLHLLSKILKHVNRALSFSSSIYCFQVWHPQFISI